MSGGGLWSCFAPCGFLWCDNSSSIDDNNNHHQPHNCNNNNNDDNHHLNLSRHHRTTNKGRPGSVVRMTADGCAFSTMGATASTSSQEASGSGGGGGLGPYHHQQVQLQPSTSSSQGSALMRERRKKVTGFATLRKKFIRRRRSSKSCDHSRVLRDFVSDWSPLELAALLDEYESLSALKDLAVQAELARPPATTFKQDLSDLYDFKHCTDCELVFRGSIFPVHRALLSARCPYFRDLLAGCPGYGARICLELRSSPIDVPMFSSLLRYLYTGDLCPHDPSIVDVAVLKRLGDDFGNPNTLEHDLRYLLETGDYADAALIFTDGDYQRPDSGSSEYGFRPKLELPCHKAILSARSPFFRNLIQRRMRGGNSTVGGGVGNVAAGANNGTGPKADDGGALGPSGGPSDRSLHVPTQIVLDETVIPKRYARVLLHAIYLDTVDLSLILRGNGCGTTAGSLGEVQALTQNGRARLSPLEEAMELYQIGRFLELDILAQGCEDLILEWLNLDTLPMVLKWASQAHGSAWVHRQSCHYLREEFSAIASSQVLHQLDKQQLIAALHNNFLQASELEVLQAVLKWGEQELVRRMEDREPNLLSHTAHSVTRKGVKKRDLSDVELREILSELLPLVRMDHVLPPNSEVLTQAIRHGLVSTPPSHMIGDDRENLRVNAWIRTQKSNSGLFVRPRLFMPYFEEVKQLLEDHLASQQLDMLRMRMSRHLPDIPDTLYMVSRLGNNSSSSGSGHHHSALGGSGNLDVVVAAAALSAPDSATMQAMVKRELKLRQSPCCQRAMGLPLSSKHEINRQIRLRVVREFNFPDAVSDLLETASCYCAADEQRRGGSDMMLNDDMSTPPSPALHHGLGSGVMDMGNGGGGGAGPSVFGNLTFPRQQQMHHMMRQELPAIVQEGELGGTGAVGDALGLAASGRLGSYGRLGMLNHALDGHSCSAMDAIGGGGGGGGGHLSEIMPDVAMATASLGQLQLAAGGEHQVMQQAPESLQLDLGDGSSHLMGAVALNAMHHHSVQHHHNIGAPPATSSYHHYMRGSGSYTLHRHNPGGAAGGSSAGSSSYHTGPPRFL